MQQKRAKKELKDDLTRSAPPTPAASTTPPAERKHWPHTRESLLSDSFKDSAKNVIVLGLAVWSLTLVHDHYRATGRLANFALFWYFVRDVPVAVLVNVLFFVYLGAFFLLVRLVALNRVVRGFGALAYVVYSLLQFVLLTAPVALLAALDPEWGPIAGAGVSMQSAVYAMKMHSYFFTCRHVWEKLHGEKPELDRDTGDIEDLLQLLAKKDGDADAVFRSVVDFRRFWNFLVFPTLCYYLAYPRTPRVRWSRVASYLGQFLVGVLFGYVAFVHGLVPMWANILRDPVSALLKTLLPGFVTWMTLFYAVFHGLLNFLAEITRFADRHFYGPWWEAKCFSIWWRDWNTSVTDWMRRHIYFQSRQDAKFPGMLASWAVFVVSALWHEYVVIVSLHFVMLPPFLSGMMIFQIAFISLTELPLFKNTPLGNAIIWIAFLVGYPLVLYSYAACYCLRVPGVCPVD